MARIKKYSPEQNLSSFQTFIVDDTPNSEYFRITEFKDTFTGGKNGFLIEGSEYLKESTEIKIELLDVNGDPIYYEPGNGIPEYYEGISKLIAVYIYNDTPIGLGKITILGELKEYDDNGVKREVPAEWKGAYNVKWERTFQINKSLPNEDKVRFYRRPAVTIDEIVKPIFSGNPPVVTQTGTLDGIPLVPTQGGNLSNFTLPTSYRLKVNSGNNWTGSIEGEVISFDNINYSPTINEVVNETELIVSPPYSQNNIVQSFTNEDYSLEFPYIEGVSDLATALTGSFAKISITDMKTFVGDAARVKVFRRSQSNLTDFEFVQEIQLESNEVLRDITTFAKKEEPYGFFSQPVINDYWVTSSNDFNVSFNQNYLYNSAKLDSSPNNFFFTSQSFSIQDGVEYTLDFNVRVSGSIDNTDYLKVFLSGSNNGTGVSQPITTINASNGVLQKTNINENIVADAFDSAKLYFEVSGSDWYINNVSLKASQETSFSPDEITFIQQVPKTLVEETFDYRFEFYDINNNFIPVRVEDTKTFVGGNTNLFNKSIEINADNLYFSFDSASNPANPLPPTVINFEVDTNIVTGSINYTSGAFDFFGNEISASEYIGGQYPGLLRNREEQNGRLPFLTVQDFTGSRDDLLVQFIRFTAEVEGVSDSIIITRVEDGKGGVSFEIVPYRGTQIKNKESKTLEVQAVRVDGINRIDLQSGLTRDFSEAKLHLLSASLDGLQETTTYVSLSQAITDTNFIQGVSAGLTGSGEIDYNAIFTRDAIDNELTLYLMDGPTSESILTSLILTDLKDGLNPGLVTSTTDQFNIKYKPREASPFNPLESIVTASFQRRGTTLNPISASLKVIPSSSIEPKTELPQLFMFYETGAFDDTVGVVVTDYLGNTINNGIPGVTLDETSGTPISFYQAVETKQLNFEFTYTEPITSASVTANKSFFITPDGLPGQDSITIDIDPNPIALGSNHKGEVFNYALADTNIQISQGDYFLINTASGDPGTFTTRSVVPTNIVYGTLEGNSTTTMSLAGFETMSALSASVRYDFDIYPYFTASLITASRTQKFTKVVEGGGAIEVTLDPIAVSFNADESGYISDYSAGKTEVIIKQNDEFFFYDENDSGTPGTFVTASISASNISFSEVSTSFDDLTASGSVDSTGGEVLHFKGFSGMNRNDVSASILYNFKVYPYSLKGGVAGVPRIVSKKQTFSKVNDGSKARKVSLAASADTVIYDGDGIKVSPQGSITLTATAFNTSGSAYFKFIDDEGGTIQVSSTDNTVNTLSPLPGTGSVRTYTVELRDGNPSGDVADVDSVSISGVQEGSTPYIALLENPASSVTVEVDGTTYFDNAGTLIRAYKGGTELQYVEEYDESAVDPITFLPIGTFGQFSASVHDISSFLTQGTLRDSKEIVSSSGELYASASAITNWTTPQSNTQGAIIYKIDFENGRGTQFLQQSFSTVFEGATGPGLVVRGEWDETIAYIFDLTQKRRDAVFRDVSGTVHYWATTQDLIEKTEYTEESGPSADGVYTGQPSVPVSPNGVGYVDPTTGWQYLGEQDFFVAAKMAIFEESFVKNTINVGEPATSYAVNPQIAIVGGTDEPYISIGQSTQGYGKKGAYIGVTSDGGPASSEGGLLSLSGDETAASFNALTWDGETLTIRGALRQTAAGGREGTLQGLWADAAGTFEFVVNDIVSHAGKSWVCILQHTKNTSQSEPLNGTDHTDYWAIAADAGTSGTAGTAGSGGATAKTIRLSSTAQAFVKPKDSATLTPASITFTSNRQNISTATGWSTTPSGITLGGSGDTRTLSNTDFGSNTAVTVTATADGLSDEITIVKVEEGSDAITIVNSNQSHNVPAASDGTVTSGNLAGSGTTIKVFEGATLLDFTTGTAGAGEFSISVVQSPSSTMNSFTIGGNGTDTATVPDFTSMDSGTDSVVITYTLTVVKNDGTSVTLTTTQTLTKSKAGSDGAAGTPAGVVYAGEWKLTLPDGSTPNLSNKLAYLSEDDLVYVVKEGSNYYTCETTHRYCGTSTGGNVVGDVILFSGNYYIANKSTADDPQGEPADWDDLGTDISPGASLSNGYVFWASFGAEFTSVATDILFANDVYADRTINVGTDDGSPVIALNADAGGSPAYSNPFIGIGQSTPGFLQDGIFMGYTGGNPVLSFVSESTFFKYESGSIELSDASFVGSGSIIEGSTIQVGKNPSNVNGYNFTVTRTGLMSASQAYISGSVNASDGRIGNWIIDPSLDGEGGVLRDNDSEIILDPNIPELQFYSESALKVKVGPTPLTTIEEIQETFTWASGQPTIPETSVTSDSDFFPESVTANTNATNNSFAVSAGTFEFTDIDWPTITIVQPGDVAPAGSNVYPNYSPSFDGEIHGDVFFDGLTRSTSAKLYLDVLDGSNGDVKIGQVLLRNGVANGAFPSQARYVGVDSGAIQSVIGTTKITLADGTTKLAKDITLDDKILSWDSENEKWVGARLSKVIKRTVSEVYKVTIGDKVVEVSDTHGFWLFGNEKNSGQISSKYLYERYEKGLDLSTQEFKVWIKDGNSKKNVVIDKVERIEKEEEVITFSVPRYVNYLSNDIISHNVIGGGLNWQIQDQSLDEAASGNITLNSGTGQTKTISISTTTTTAKLRFRLYVEVWSGRTVDVSANGSTTSNWFTHTANVGTGASGNQVYAASSTMDSDGISITKSNNFVELKPGGVQVVSSDQVYVKARRKDNLTNTTAADATIFEVIGGTSEFKAAAQPYTKAIVSEGHIVPKNGTGPWDLGSTSGEYWENGYFVKLNGGYFDTNIRHMVAGCQIEISTSNVPTPTNDFNISGVTRNSTGVYTVSFSNTSTFTLEDSYAMVQGYGRSDNASSNAGDNAFTQNWGTKVKASNVEINSKDNDSNTDTDPYRIYFTLFGR